MYVDICSRCLRVFRMQVDCHGKGKVQASSMYMQKSSIWPLAVIFVLIPFPDRRMEGGSM
jgi:uncharacterized metal-binding protein YceD (DUF177 family)